MCDGSLVPQIGTVGLVRREVYVSSGDQGAPETGEVVTGDLSWGVPRDATLNTVTRNSDRHRYLGYIKRHLLFTTEKTISLHSIYRPDNVTSL